MQTRFREDLDADSLDLYELVMELEDTYGVADERGAGGQDRDRRRRGRLRARAASRCLRGRGRSARGRAARAAGGRTAAGIDRELEPHARLRRSPTAPGPSAGSDSYERLAFLGDSVLGLAVAEHLFERFPRADIGGLTKIHGQAVSGRACAEVAIELGVPEMLAEADPSGVRRRHPRRGPARQRARAGLESTRR